MSDNNPPVIDLRQNYNRDRKGTRRQRPQHSRNQRNPRRQQKKPDSSPYPVEETLIKLKTQRVPEYSEFPSLVQSITSDNPAPTSPDPDPVSPNEEKLLENVPTWAELFQKSLEEETDTNN